MNIKTRHLYMLKRKEKKITHNQVAEAIGVSQSSISQYETGKIQLKKATLEAYINYIDNYTA